MDRHLTAKERQKLVNSHRKERHSKIRDRIKAILLYDKGYSYTEIAEILLLDDETIRRQAKDYFSKKKLKPENGGSQSALTERQSEKLVAHLQEHTYRYVKNICTYVKMTFTISYTNSGMTKWLHAHGFRYKKPHAVPAKADKSTQKSFIKYYEQLKKKSRNKESIYFVDSVHPEHQTRLAHGWIMKGERKEIAMTGRQYRNLPPYSQNLNPIERLWKIMHEQVTYNRYYEKFSDFTEAIQYFFRHIGKKKKLLRARITDNFQLLDAPNFAS